MALLMSIKRNVNVSPGGGVPAVYHVSQGDLGTRIILGLLSDNADYTIPEGTTAIIRGSRSDGTTFEQITADVETTEIKFNLTEDITAIAGPVECEAVMSSGSANVIGTANFVIEVEESPIGYAPADTTDATWAWILNKLSTEQVAALGDDVIGAINSKLDADNPDLQGFINDWLDEHPEATTTVVDESLTIAKLSNTLKSSTIPLLTDFGELSVDTFDSVMEKDIPFLRLRGSLISDEPLIITRPCIIISESFTFTQTVWGYPAIIVLSDNVTILGEINLICNVETRDPVTNSYYPETVDKKADSSGIILGHNSTNKNFYAERVNVYNFISGIVTSNFTNVVIKYLYVENVDFGVFGSGYKSLHIGTVEFKDIASYVGSDAPSHAVYLTGGSSIGLSKNVIIDNIFGDGCQSKTTDTVISVKSTTGFICKQGYVKNIAGLCSVLVSSGVVENIIVENATAGISAQLAETDFIYKNLNFKKIDVSDEHINYFVECTKVKVIDCVFNVNSDDAEFSYVYINGGYYEYNCEYISPSDSSATLYERAGSSVHVPFHVYNPKASIVLLSGDASMENAYMLIDPERLNYPKTNCFLPNPHYIENNYIADEPSASANYPYGFRTNDKVRVTDASGVQYFNTANVTNGVVYTLINGGNASISETARIKTKSGNGYTTEQWTIFRFMNIGNIAYEI